MGLSADKKIQYTEGVELSFPVEESTTIYAGALVCVNANGYAVPADDTSGLIFVGIAREYVDNSSGSDGDENVVLRRRGLFKMELGTAITQANVGDNVFIVDDETVDLTAQTDNDIFCGIIAGYIDSTHAWIDIEPAIRQADVATHIADTDGAHAASAISVADSGGLITADEVEAALAEVFTHIQSGQVIMPIPLTSITMEDGTALTKQASTTAGFAQLSDKEVVIKIPVDCASGEELQATIPVPQDIDDSADITVHVLAGKDADNDTLTLDCEVFPCAVGDTANADIQDTAAQTITQAASELVFTCGADGVLAAPGTLTIVLLLGGTNDGDAVYIYGAWIEYTRKTLTS